MVYYCSVKGCKNNSKMKKKDPNIVLSFHAFPVKDITKQKWLRAIGRPSWKPPSFARICSAHFDLDQISYEGCRIRMMEDACPVKSLPPNSNFEASDVEVCRICLGTDVKMFSLQEGLLNTCLQSFAGLKENCSIEGLPQYVCYECSARLINCYNLIEQSFIAQAVLLDIFYKNGQVTKRLVKLQNRRTLGLESSLQSQITTSLNQYIFRDDNVNDLKVNECTCTETNNLDIQNILTIISHIKTEISKRDYFDEGLKHILAKAYDDLEVTRIKIEEAKKTVLFGHAIKESVFENERSLDQSKMDMLILSEARNNLAITKSRIAEAPTSIFNDKYAIKEENTTENDLIDSLDESNKEMEILSEKDVLKIKGKLKKTDITKDRSKYPCQVCKIDFMSEEARRVHLLSSNEHKEMPDLCDPAPPNPVKNACSKCGVTFSTMKDLVTHMKTEHPRSQRRSHITDGYPTKCEHCEEMMNNRSEHWLHVRRQHPSKKHTYCARKNCVCHSCGKLFQNSTKLRAHELSHGPAAVPCPSCPRVFHHKYALTRHARTHERPTHACHLCARAFRNKHNLDRHQRVHTGETPFSCNLCDKRFKHSTGLKLHIRSVHCNLPPPKRSKLTIES